MPRALSLTSRIYQAGAFGPFSIDSFTKSDADRIQIDLTVEGWPDIPVVAIITLQANNGSVMTVNVPGRPKNRDGSDAAVFSPSLGFIADSIVVDGAPQPAVKRNVSSASVAVEVLTAFRTAITVRAL